MDWRSFGIGAASGAALGGGVGYIIGRRRAEAHWRKKLRRVKRRNAYEKGGEGKKK